MKEPGTCRQVSFNIEEELYTEFKKRILDDHATPTAYLDEIPGGYDEESAGEVWDRADDSQKQRGCTGQFSLFFVFTFPAPYRTLWNMGWDSRN